jgi:hypothetical protein
LRQGFVKCYEWTVEVPSVESGVLFKTWCPETENIEESFVCYIIREVLQTLNQHDSDFGVAAFNKEDRFPRERVASLQIIAGPVGVQVRDEDMKGSFNGATKENVGGLQIIQVFLGHIMCWDGIKEGVVAKLNHLGRHMWLSEVQSEEDGINLQTEGYRGIVLRKARAARAK